MDTTRPPALPHVITESHPLYRTRIPIGPTRTCACPPHHLACITAKEWVTCQIGVWRVAYERRDIRDATIHPAPFPLALAKRVIRLFTHEGELVLDPFVGSGTTLVAARDEHRNAIGVDLHEACIATCGDRLAAHHGSTQTRQLAIHDDARQIPTYIAPETVSLIWTSPPYANLLNRQRGNKSRRHRRNDRYGKVEQYSQDPRDLGTMDVDAYINAMGDIFAALLPLFRPKAHCVINVADMWWNNHRMTLHVALIDALRNRGYELRNIIIWDRTNIVNAVGIFG